MNISTKILKEVIDSRVATINEQLTGICEPKINKYEAIEKLGVISALVLDLYDKVDEPLKDSVWELKHESDTLIEKLFSMWVMNSSNM